MAPGNDRFHSADAAPTLAELKKVVADNPIVIWSKSFCPFCIQAKQLLDKYCKPHKHKYWKCELDEIPHMTTIQAQLKDWTGQPTVPMIFIGGEFIGGCTDLQNLDDEDQLKPKIEAALGV